MAAAPPDPRTLDLREPQIIRHYPLDGNGFFWHHRVLLEKCGPGIWIGLSPDGDLERIDLNTVAHIALDRRSPFPAPQAAFVYAFDEMSRAELEGYRRRAKVMVNLFNDMAFEEVEGHVWLVSDPTHRDFGKELDEDLIATGVSLRDNALVEKDGEELFATKVATDHREQWILAKEQSKGDCRLLGLHVDGQGGRFLEFGKAVDTMKPASLPDWPLNGPKATLEFLKAVRTGATDLITYHLHWAQHSGISQFAAAKHEHRSIMEALKAFITYDQIDASNSLGVEFLIRRAIMIETATARSPTNPDFSGLDLVLEAPIGQGGEAQTLKFNEWVGTRLKERATIQKQSRLYKEEFSKRKTGDDGDDQAKGKGKGKSKAKAKAAPSSGAAPSA